MLVGASSSCEASWAPDSPGWHRISSAVTLQQNPFAGVGPSLVGQPRLRVRGWCLPRDAGRQSPADVPSLRTRCSLWLKVRNSFVIRIQAFQILQCLHPGANMPLARSKVHWHSRQKTTAVSCMRRSHAMETATGSHPMAAVTASFSFSWRFQGPRFSLLPPECWPQPAHRPSWVRSPPAWQQSLTCCHARSLL